MGLESRIKPISYLKANAAEVLRELNEGAEPLVITQNGEAKAVLQDAESYYRMQETLALAGLRTPGPSIARFTPAPLILSLSKDVAQHQHPSTGSG